jgi:hypothetical protein
VPDFQPAGPCPICLHPDVRLAADDRLDAFHIRCAVCGQHLISNTALGTLRRNMTTIERARLAFGLSKVPPSQLVGSSFLEQLGESSKLPGAMECIDNLVIHFAETVPIGGILDKGANALQAAIGATDAAAALWVVQEAINAGLLSTNSSFHIEDPAARRPLRLTAAGWARHAELMRDGVGSRHAFMAMDFKQADIAELLDKHLKPNVERRINFELRTTNHAQKTAGLIDSRMRVELRTSRFVVCDLTHNNRGAYWEAGFAEGIGRPVFYLCRQDVLESKDPEIRPHFDIAHQAIVKWDLANPGPAVDELVAMIRATLPSEARMED